MSNPFDPGATSGAPVGTAGAPTTFFDNFTATLQEAARNDRWLGVEDEVQIRWADSLRALKTRGVEVPDNNALRLIEDTIDPEKSRPFARWFMGVDDTSPQRVAQYEAAEKINEQIRALNDPNISSIEDIIDQVKTARGERREHTAEVAEAGDSIGAFFGRLAGGVVGAGTDAAQVPTLMAGGVGKTIAMRLATETAVNAAVGAGIQSEMINPQNRLLGEAEGSVGEAALYGGLAGFALRGAGEGLGVLTQRALQRMGRLEVDAFNFNDAQLRSMFEAAPDSPTSRAGLLALDDNAHFASSNSYVDTDAGLRRFTGEAEDILRSYSGDTAVGRFLAPVEEFNLDNLDYHTQVVREMEPLVFARLEEASGRVAELDAEIVATQNSLDNISVSQVLGKIDEDTGHLVASYEADLANPLLGDAERTAIQQKIDGISESLQAVPEDKRPLIAEAEARLEAATTKAEQLAAARDLDKLYKNVGEDVLGKAVAQVEVPLKKKLQALRASRKAAGKEFRAARKAMDTATERVKAAERIKQLLNPQQGVAVGAARMDVEAMRPDRVEAHAKAVDDAIAELPKMNDAPLENYLNEDGMINLGDGVVLDPEFKLSDPDVEGGQIYARDLYKKMVMDEQMLEAMRVCSI